MMDRYQWGILIGLVLFVIIVVAGGTVLMNNKEDGRNSLVPTCDTYANWKSKDVPARCIQYFNNPTN